MNPTQKFFTNPYTGKPMTRLESLKFSERLYRYRLHQRKLERENYSPRTDGVNSADTRMFNQHSAEMEVDSFGYDPFTGDTQPYIKMYHANRRAEEE